MNKRIQLTVLMPVYNGGVFLRGAIESILRQTFTEFELLIIDDASKDDSANVVKQFDDQRIHLVQNEKNLGLIGTLNKGISLAKGELIARMDQDDISAPDRLAKQIAFLEKNPEIVAVGSAMNLLSTSGESVGFMPALHGSETLKRALTVTNPFVHPSMLLRRAAVQQVGGYRKEAYAAEDYDLWCRLAQIGPMENLIEPLLSYRLNPLGMSISLRSTQKRTSASLAETAWQKYGKQGPASVHDWNDIWPKIGKNVSAPEKMLYSRLHLFFAQGYRRRGSWGLGFRHLLASLRMNAANKGSYFALSMFIMPFDWYAQIEDFIAVGFNNARANKEKQA